MRNKPRARAAVGLAVEHGVVPIKLGMRSGRAMLSQVGVLPAACWQRKASLLANTDGYAAEHAIIFSFVQSGPHEQHSYRLGAS